MIEHKRPTGGGFGGLPPSNSPKAQSFCVRESQIHRDRGPCRNLGRIENRDNAAAACVHPCSPTGHPARHSNGIPSQGLADKLLREHPGQCSVQIPVSMFRPRGVIAIASLPNGIPKGNSRGSQSGCPLGRTKLVSLSGRTRADGRCGMSSSDVIALGVSLRLDSLLIPGVLCRYRGNVNAQKKPTVVRATAG